jgi:hypothetical protein
MRIQSSLGAIAAVLACSAGLGCGQGSEQQPATAADRKDAVATVKKETPQATLPSFAGSQWYVASEGKPDGDGSEAKPWDMDTAMAGPASVKPGDVIWIAAGEYKPAGGKVKVMLKGEKNKPIVVRNKAFGRVTVHGGFDVGSATGVGVKHVWIWGLEAQSRGHGNSDGFNVGNSTLPPDATPGVKVINNLIHDCGGSGMGNWGSASDHEVNGNILYNNGFDGPERGHCHGFYVQNKGPNGKLFKDNVIFRHFFLGTQLYGTGNAYRDNVTYDGNTFFNNGEPSLRQLALGRDWQGIYIGGGRVGKETRYVNNMHYVPADVHKGTNNWGNSADSLIQGNYFVAPAESRRVALDLSALGPNTNLKVQDNTFIGLIVGFEVNQLGTGNVHLPERPTTGNKIFIRKNDYEEGRANIIIFNWGKSDTVEVDVKDAGLKNGEEYEVRDVQNWYSKPVASGTFLGKPVVIPMTGLTVPAYIGLDPAYKTPPHTAPEFGVFVILKKGTAGA